MISGKDTNVNYDEKKKKRYLNEYLKKDNKQNINDDFSLEETDFIFTASIKTKLTNCIISLKDDNTEMDFRKFGSERNQLTNGIRFWYKEKPLSNKRYIDGGFPVKNNNDIVKLSSETKIYNQNYYGYLNSTWNFTKSGTDISLYPGGSFGITVNDDLRLIDGFTILVQGYSYIG